MSVDGENKMGSSHEVLVGIYNHLGDLRATQADLCARIGNVEQTTSMLDRHISAIQEDVHSLRRVETKHAVKWGILTFVVTLSVTVGATYVFGNVIGGG